MRHCGTYLNEKRRLLLVQPNLTSRVAHYRCEPRMFPIRPVDASVWCVGECDAGTPAISVCLVCVSVGRTVGERERERQR